VPQEYRFSLPVKEEDVRKLKVGDTVYLSGIIHTMRDMGHRRSVEMLKRGEELPFNLSEGAIWHCGPIVQKNDDGWVVKSAGSTTSSRFTFLGADLVRQLKVRFVLGKGTMGSEMVQAMKETGAVFLNLTGGCAGLYGEKVEGVETVYWTDISLPEATWVLGVKDFGPMVVGIDSHGGSLFENMKKGMKEKLKVIYKRSSLPEDYNFSYLPKRVAGKVL